jgi:hypothetical protein
MDTEGDSEREPSGSDSSLAVTSFQGRSSDSTERAVTPLVANILLVAVVLVVAMVVLTLAFGILDEANGDPPVTSFDVDRGSHGQLSLVAAGGNPVETDRLTIRFGTRTYAASSYLSADEVTAGTAIGPVYPNEAEAVELVWEDRDSSAVLYRTDVAETDPIRQYLRFEDSQIGSYGTSQDGGGEYRYTTGSRRLVLQNNTWKYVPFERGYTNSSVLAFDFKSTDEGEIHGIGLEDDTAPSSNRIFKLFGTQGGWADQYGSYSTSDGWVHYEIPVGQLYSEADLESAAYLAFVNDLDDGTETSESQFRNIRVYNQSTTPMKLTVDGTAKQRQVQGYGSQDADGTYDLQDDGDTLQLTENTWKYVSIDVAVTSQTNVSFEFNSTSEGEIHAIGFETDGSETESQFVRLDGTQSWGVSYGSYQTGDGWVRYEINIDNQTGLAGTNISRLVFVNDDDGDADGVSQFRNVSVSKTG